MFVLRSRFFERIFVPFISAWDQRFYLLTSTESVRKEKVSFALLPLTPHIPTLNFIALLPRCYRIFVFISVVTDAPISVLGLLEIGVGGSYLTTSTTFMIQNKYDQ